MAGRLLRRSGIAVALIAELIEWRPTLIVQVGIGHFWHEVDVMQEAWPGVRFVGFEPHPILLEKDIRGKYPGVVHEVALGENNGTAFLWFKNAHMEGASVYIGDDAGCAVTTPVRRMDEFVIGEDGDEILYWLDCEGSELSALKGSTEFLKRVNVVNIEVTGKPPRPGWPSPVEVNRWMLDRGFVSQYIHTHRCSSGQCDVVYVRPRLFRPEFCSCPLAVEDYWRRYGSVV